jgi:nitrate/nitrite transport system substrate-binding protein
MKLTGVLMARRTVTSIARRISRRDFLKETAGTAALLAAAKLNLPAGAFAQGAGPEVKGAKLGFIALTDAAPLFVAKEKGIFAKYGMPDVEVAKQASWGATRDNLVLGGERRRRWSRHQTQGCPPCVSEHVPTVAARTRIA